MQSGVDRGTKGENRDNPSNRQSAQSDQKRWKKTKGMETTSYKAEHLATSRS